MTELLTAAQMRSIEQAAIASGQVTGLELMERAGQGVVEAIFEEWPELARAPSRAVVLCGPGNNGGDGFVVARLLKGWGWEVEVFLYGDAERLPPDARVNYERWVGMGEVRMLDETAPVYLSRPDLVVDALFGIGLSRSLHGILDDMAREAMDMAAVWYDVAIDMPSGLDSDSGKPLGSVFPAELTVSFHAPKVGHVLEDGPARCGKLRIVDIGLEQTAGRIRGERNKLPLLERQRLSRETITLTFETSQLYKGSDEHKYAHGHVLILSGPSGHTGAARLAARGALRIGAGVVTVGCPPDALPENAARLDAVMLREVADAAGLQGVLEDKRINALCLGPGMGTGARQAELLGVALASRGEPRPTGPVGRGSPRLRRHIVLDADALTLLSQHPDLFAALHEGCVLTPHAGEFARLFPDIAAKLAEPATRGPAYSKVDATREAAARAGCVVLYKGPDTVIAAPEGRCAINAAVYDRAAPWLATAGSGDVLAGFITGLLARGFSPFDAACTGAWLHVECARSFGPGLIAEDLPEELPKVFRALDL
ncbi:NAD(P)H-hydrate dehydratase [Fuscibacter oryzae]|uniref:Bifunctional NAD(P)H-hydrate repair enzyme n=1 Tax=Fuscibacter oryzae TaxID=2803939 RepID=A0A8J7MQB4_9RHOB|nr:NAD(P)H-hydrate dehydratase [Fuscibacter oryzae]MBL4927853.1 NAD(P)H-hydrate dehydratase [Fuscibacter oryzae]